MRLAVAGLRSYFKEGVTILTPTPLLACVAAEQCNRFEVEQGVETWQRPAILSIDAWLVSCWQEARYNDACVPSLLSLSQELLLWRSIIERQNSGLFDAGATARLAARSARLLCQWDIPLNTDLWRDHADGQEFQRWHELFRAKCDENNWTTRAELWRLVPDWLNRGLCANPAIVLAGLDTPHPALQRLKQSLLNVVEIPISATCSHRAPVTSLPAFDQEIEFSARWARSAFEQNGARSIAVFVPDLAGWRSQVEQTFKQVFFPSSALRFDRPRRGRATIIDPGKQSVFHINAASTLESHPLVSAALLFLELARPRIHYSLAGAILRSPFLGGASFERSARAIADLELRRRRDLDFSFHDIERVSTRCPRLTTIWGAVRQIVRKKRNIDELAGWSGFFGDLLQATGWPGDAELSEQEQEAVDAWKDALSTLAALGMVSGPVPLDTALIQLRGVLAANGMEIGDFSSPIQILDAAEARGLQFDSAILTGLSDEMWPPPASLSPLIPLKLQRACNVAYASAESIQGERERATTSLFAAAENVQATYSGRLSPLVEGYIDREITDPPRWSGKLARASYVPVSLHEVEDASAPPYVAGQSTRGGTSIIRAQSLCPFRAFAEFRLAAQSPEDASFGFDGRDRGGFLHEAMQHVWEELRTQVRLCSMDSSDVRSIVREAVANAVRRDEASPLHELSASTERERLQDLILEWLEIERSRKQPFTVETVEQERYYEISGLRLRLRVDRIDRLPNGHLVLIDYKSGGQTRTKLEGCRPAEPQLLVYSACLGNDVDGIFFAQLKPRELRAVGFSQAAQFPGNAVKIVKDWDAFLRDSRANIEAIASEFMNGHAAVDPIKGACEYCNVVHFCRVRGQGSPDEEDNE